MDSNVGWLSKLLRVADPRSAQAQMSTTLTSSGSAEKNSDRNSFGNSSALNAPAKQKYAIQVSRPDTLSKIGADLFLVRYFSRNHGEIDGDVSRIGAGRQFLFGR